MIFSFFYCHITIKEGKFWIQELIVQEVVTNWCQKHNQQETNL